MNDEIKELAVEAGLYTKTSDGFIYPTELSYDDLEMAHQKFAKLIIMNCVKACVQDVLNPRDSIEMKCARKILAHFGVK